MSLPISIQAQLLRIQGLQTQYAQTHQRIEREIKHLPPLKQPLVSLLVAASRGVVSQIEQDFQKLVATQAWETLPQAEETFRDVVREQERTKQIILENKHEETLRQDIFKLLQKNFANGFIPQQERGPILKKLEEFTNLEEAKAWAEGVVREARDKRREELKASRPKPVATPPPIPVAPKSEEEDIHLRSVRTRASRLETKEAKAFYRQGLQASSRHDAVRLFKRAIHAEEEARRPKKPSGHKMGHTKTHAPL